MSPGHRYLRRLVALLIRGRDAELILADLEEARERDLARGLSPVRARRRYLVNVLGSAFSLQWARLLSTVGARGSASSGGRRRGLGWAASWLDFKLGLRLLVKQPGLTCVAVFALAVGIPVGLAPMHVVRAIHRPLPFAEGERIQMLRNVNVETARDERPSLYDFAQWREQLASFEALGAATVRTSFNVISDGGRAAPAWGAAVTASTFDILRAPPLHGRILLAADEAVAAPEVVVIGHALWQSRLDGDPEVIGRTIRVGGVPHTVVGVMPKEFLFPVRDQLWVPLRVDAQADDHRVAANHRIFGRLADGVTPAEAQAELETVGRRMAAADPERHERLRPEVVPYAIGFFGLPKAGMQTEPGFFIVQILTLLLLVVACANVGMLVLARTAGRSGELAVRTALGANRGRVLSQLFTEAMVFSLLAAALGLFVGHQIASRLILNDMLPFWIDLGLTRETALSALTLAALSAGIVGVVPALKVTGKAVQKNLQNAATSRAGIRFGWMSSALIVANVTIAVATLGLATGLAEGLTEVADEMGIEADEFLHAELNLPWNEVAEGAAPLDPGERKSRFARAQQELARRLLAEPGVRGVAIASHLPGMDHPVQKIEVEGERHSAELEGHRVRYARVEIGFFDALARPILSGRGFGPLDLEGDRSVAVVNTTFVERVLGGRNPIGRRIRQTGGGEGEEVEWREIVGVVGHLGMNVAIPGNDAGIYYPWAAGELNLNHVRVAIHVGDDPESFTPRLRALASEVEPAAMIEDPMALDEVFSFSSFTLTWMKRGAAILLGIMVALSTSGIYALMSFTIAQRRKEIGIRAALGAQWRRIFTVIAGPSFTQLGLGMLLGSVVAGRLLYELQRDLGRIPTHSPIVLALVGSASVMLTIGALGCTVPTLRALRIHPTEALKSDGT